MNADSMPSHAETRSQPAAGLLVCPRCHRPGFTRRGLRAHLCRGTTPEQALRANRRRLTAVELASALSASA